MLKKTIIASALMCAGFTAHAAGLNDFSPAKNEQTFWVTIGQDAVQELRAVGAKEFFTHSALNANSKDIAIAQLSESRMSDLSRLMHETKNRCGGYIVHDTLQSAILAQSQDRAADSFATRALSQSSVVESLVPNLSANNIVDTITYLSTQFVNRYHTTTAGRNASNGLRDRWANIVNGTSWASVGQVTHNSTNQKSVVVTLTGSEAPDEIVVLGGHLDSTVGGGVGENTSAPGADDDASGIATLGEILRVYVEAGVQPKRTVKFYGYAAEEVGLVGSGEIAASAQSAGDNIVGVLQLDMTNYDGSVNDVTLMTDYTSSTQNAYIQNLLNTYFGSGSSLGHITHGTDSCGYGCSDHASWNNRGFPASMPFETRMSQYNPRIHTSGDTLANMDTTGQKALKFAKLGLAYLVEMAADTGSGGGGGGGGDTTLENGVAKTGLASSTELNYTMDVPAGATDISFNMSGGSGDADLYVKKGSAPTDSSYDCRPYAGGNNESCGPYTTSNAATYHVRLKAYSAFSNVSLTGSFTEDTGGGGGGGGLPAVNETRNVTVARNAWQRESQTLLAGYSSFDVNMSGGSGDADLYVNFGSQSTTSNYDCRPYRNGNNETCSFNNPQAGTWHIDVRGYSAASGVTLNWSATE